MILVAGAIVLGIVVLIAAWFVLREAGRLAKDPPGALFDAEDACDWVVQTLPDDVAATLVVEDVRRIVGFQLELLEGAAGTAPVVGSAEQVDYVCARAAATGEAYLPEQVAGVLDAALVYFAAIGAIGPPASEDDRPGPPNDRPK